MAQKNTPGKNLFSYIIIKGTGNLPGVWIWQIPTQVKYISHIAKRRQRNAHIHMSIIFHESIWYVCQVITIYVWQAICSRCIDRCWYIPPRAQMKTVLFIWISLESYHIWFQKSGWWLKSNRGRVLSISLFASSWLSGFLQPSSDRPFF